MIKTFFANLGALYGWRAAAVFASLLAAVRGNPFVYWGRFWTTQNFAAIPVAKPLHGRYRGLAELTRLGMLLQLALGGWLIWLGVRDNRPDNILFGAAVVVAYPLVWALLLPVWLVIDLLTHPKRLGKHIICRMLEAQVRQLRARHQFSLVAVAGSVGKTSTKLAVANLLEQTRRVRYQAGNYNDRLTVPLVLFGHDEPGLYNGFAWLRILLSNWRQIRREFPYDIVVVELGTDGPGQMGQFAYLKPDLALVTAVAPEHMEQFGTLDAVAAEELDILGYAAKLLVNIDDIDAVYLDSRQYMSYGGKTAMYALKSARAIKLGSQRVTYDLAGRKYSKTIHLVGPTGAKIALAAVAVACELALSQEDIDRGLAGLQPVAGRMQLLDGIKNAVLIDDTYNASPSAVAAALRVMQNTKAPQRIAILGSMNELGQTSDAAHQAAGELCDPSWLDLVVTIGQQAKTHLAPAAKAQGCTVKSFLNPREAGMYVQTQLRDGAVVLAKGSQNGVFAEEALKPLLANPGDASKLVRQSRYWLRLKQRQLGA